MKREGLSMPTAHDVKLDLLSMTEWRVRDRRFAETDSRGVLGFVERRGFVYEVTRMDDPGRIIRCGSLASATAEFTAHRSVVVGKPE